MGKVIAFDAPNKDESSDKSIFKVFLGGTIDNGDSVDWQHKIINTLKEREDYQDRWLVDFVDSDTRNEYGDKVVTVGWCGEYNGKKGIFYFNDEFTKRAKIIPEKEILCVE